MYWRNNSGIGSGDVFYVHCACGSEREYIVGDAAVGGGSYTADKRRACGVDVGNGVCSE